MTKAKYTESRETRSWPAYLFGGRLRTSTLTLIVAFIAIWWLYDTYQPVRPAFEQIPASDVVPPGFVPDPSYTWVPRTDVQRQVETSATTTPETSESPTTSTTSGESTSPAPSSGASTTVTTTPSTTPTSGASTASVTPSPSSSAVMPPLTHPTARPSNAPSSPTPASPSP